MKKNFFAFLDDSDCLKIKIKVMEREPKLVGKFFLNTSLKWI